MKKYICFLILLFTTSCAQYWNKPGVNLQQTAADLHECRVQGNSGGQKLYTAAEMEGTCMGAKGYALKYSPPPQ